MEERTTERTTENPLKKLQSITIDDEDEPDLIIRPATSDGNKATENFLNRAFVIFQMHSHVHFGAFILQFSFHFQLVAVGVGVAVAVAVLIVVFILQFSIL